METANVSLNNNRALSTSRAILSGLLTGQAAGLIMAVVIMAVFTIFLGKGPLFPVQVIGSTFWGEAGLQGFHVGAFLTGLVLHQLGPSLFWGVVFGLAASELKIRSAMGALTLGVALGVVSMIVDVYFLVPMVMNALQGTDIWAREVPIGWDWAAHVVFGASFFLYPAIQKQLRH